MVSTKVSIYLGQKMTGLYCDELLLTALAAKAKLEQAGFEVLSPVIEEGVPNKHVKLVNSLGRLKAYWKRDKEMLQQAHLMIDFESLGKSDGVNVEMGYVRFALWKPLVRIHPTLGCVISKLEYDNVFASLEEAIPVIQKRWGTKRKLLLWRLNMLNNSLFKFIKLQIRFIKELI
jgi:hypothetical protein